ncbi:MAG TPA: hypothetical protein VEV15_12825 [Flavisolibacter sp.]|nr:hypothetical protein [Flavisolibacter sp.]
MGLLNRFDLCRIVKEYKIRNFFETGTFWGDGVAYALQAPFQKLVSVEVIPEIADKAKHRFEEQSHVEIIEGESVAVLESELPKLDGNCIFWLDAHFPGADAGLTTYDDDDNNEATRLPLPKELEVISRLRSKFKDVLILDDLRIYEDGPYQNGNVPDDALPKMSRNIDFVYQYFGATHLILKSYLDEGYILLFPKNLYKRRHFSLLNICNKQPFVEDHYLVNNGLHNYA